MRMKQYGVVIVFVISVICGMIVLPVCAGTHAQVLNPRLLGNSVGNMDTGHRTADHLTVMTMNVYVGADVDQILSAQDPTQIPILVALAFQQLLATNFFERAEAIAERIQSAQPHLVGLQEISRIRIQSPGDAVGGGSTPATVVLFDYLEILLDALAARGLDYQVAGMVRNADIEMPMLASLAPLAFDDVRLTDYDVILARGDVAISNVTADNYAAALQIADLGIEIPRGYVAVDAGIKKNHTYRFVNTHLEPADLDTQLAQAEELLALLEDEKKPVILVGDFNTPAPAGETYQLLEAADYVDVWTRNLRRREGEGFTFPHDADLQNETVHLSQRIDHIFVRNRTRGHSVLGAVFATVWGDALDERTSPSLLWPSDHAAVIATLQLPVLGENAYAK